MLNATGMRMRKKYLVFRKDGNGNERMTLGVFSSKKRAESSIRKDSTQLSAACRESCPEASPYLESGNDECLLVLRPGKEVRYRMEICLEDKI